MKRKYDIKAATSYHRHTVAFDEQQASPDDECDICGLRRQAPVHRSDYTTAAVDFAPFIHGVVSRMAYAGEGYASVEARLDIRDLIGMVEVLGRRVEEVKSDRDSRHRADESRLEACRESEHAAHLEIERLSAETLTLRLRLDLAERDLKAVSSGIETEEDVAVVAAEEGVLLADNAALKDSLLAAREELRKLALMVERDIHGGGVKVATQAAVKDILGRPENDGPVTGYVRRLLSKRSADDPYWDRAKEISAEVATWPAWKRADLGRLIEGPK